MYNIFMQKVLLYNVKNETFKIFEKVLEKRNIPYFSIDDSCLDITVEGLFSLEEDSLGGGYHFREEYMLMKGISHEELLDILKEMHALGGEFEGIKVMYTETNASWLLKDLLEETEKEHEVMQKVLILQETLKSCNEIDFNNYSEEDGASLKLAMMDAYMYLQAGNYEKEIIEEKVQSLMDALRNIKRIES